MNLKTYLKELVDNAIDASVDFGANDTRKSEEEFDHAVETLYNAIDKLVDNKDINFEDGEITLK